MAKEGIEFHIPKRELECWIKFTENIVKAAVDSADILTENLARDADRLFHKKLNLDDVPGPPLSDSWRDHKAAEGFFTSRLQRFGRGDSRSYYENVTRRKIGVGGRTGWFVGVLKGTTAYREDGSPSGFDMADIADILEQRWPLWKEVLDRVYGASGAMFVKVFGRRLQKLGINIDLREE